jgi:hypothetical protein
MRVCMKKIKNMAKEFLHGKEKLFDFNLNIVNLLKN